MAFFEAIGEPIENEDPSDQTLDIHTQLPGPYYAMAGSASQICS
jgi:hypothetical protein